MDRRGAVTWPDRHPPGEQHGAGIQPLFHLHDGDAGLGIPGQEGSLDRPGTAPSRQQRGMDVEAAPPRRSQHGGGQDQAVSRNHRGIQAKRGEGGVLRLVAPEANGVPHG